MSQPEKVELSPNNEALLPLEIERKFLVTFFPTDLFKYVHYPIRQGYLALEGDDKEIRIREKGDKYYQTLKRGRGRVRTEVEIEITREQFEALWPATEGRRVEKIRYEIPYQGFVIELDIYKGNLSILWVAEIEFTDQSQSENFVGPNWLGREVTEDEQYKNRNLAVNGL